MTCGYPVGSSNRDDLPCGPHQKQRHNHVDGFIVPLVEREQHGPQRRPDQVSGTRANRHDDSEGQNSSHMEPVGHDVTGVEGNAQHQDLDVQKLEQKTVDLGQGL